MDAQIIETLVLILHVLAGLGVIGLVLIQHGKGAEAGSGFGGGASNTVFGSSGAGNFLTKTTTWLAIAFFITSFALAYFAKQRSVEARDLGLPQVVEQASEANVLASDAIDLEVPVIESTSSEVEIPKQADVQSASSETADVIDKAVEEEIPQ